MEKGKTGVHTGTNAAGSAEQGKIITNYVTHSLNKKSKIVYY